jgi:hypothetical protein
MSNIVKTTKPESNPYSETFEFFDFVKSNDRKFTLMHSVDDMCRYAITENVLFPGLADVALRFLFTPVSTVDCERGFSRRNLIK